MKLDFSIFLLVAIKVQKLTHALIFFKINFMKNTVLIDNLRIPMNLSFRKRGFCIFNLVEISAATEEFQSAIIIGLSPTLLIDTF